MATKDVLGNSLSGETGTGSYVGDTSPTLTTPVIAQINDTSGNEILTFEETASAVNYIYIQNAATGYGPRVQAAGDDTNVALVLNGKGNEGTRIQGIANGGTVLSGYVGEVISSVIPSASATSLTTSTAKNVTSISLTAGDWDVYGNVLLVATSGGSVMTTQAAWCSLTSATLPDSSLYNGVGSAANPLSFGGFSAPFLRVNVSSTTTVYLGAYATFASGTVTACGGIYARRAH